MNEWISVKDRLPEEKTRVLVFVPHSSIKIDTDRIVGRIWVRWNGHITHWMPLPEPPSKESEHCDHCKDGTRIIPITQPDGTFIRYEKYCNECGRRLRDDYSHHCIAVAEKT